MRCRTLAAALIKRGARVRFITRDHPGHLGDFLQCVGMQVELLPQSGHGADREGYAAWLGVSQQEDAKQTIAAMQGTKCDVLVVDHYALDSVWESLLRPHTSEIMVIDDLANRSHNCEILLDQNYSSSGAERYTPWVPSDCQLLLGPRYSLMRSEFSQARESAALRQEDTKRVLIYLGGSDPSNVTGLAFKALCAPRLEHLAVDVVVGPNFSHRPELMHLANGRSRTQVHGSLPHLADLMAHADIAIGAGGATTWERLYMGLPSIVVSIAENQEPACEALAADGFIHYLGDAQTLTVTAVEDAMVKMLTGADAWKSRQRAGAALVDGLGAERVVEVLAPSPVSELTLRPAREGDAMTYFAWVNDPMVRSSALNVDPIDLATHLDWFRRRLADPNCGLWVMEASGLPVGQIRFERRGERTFIDFSLDALARGRGWGKVLIALGVRHLSENGSAPIELHATVKMSNVASVQTFLSAGFTELQSEVEGTQQFFLFMPGMLDP